MAMAANYGNVSVVFLRHWKGYNSGEKAGFAPAIAQKLVASGVAAFDKVEKPATSPVTKKPALTPKPKRKVSRKKTAKKKKKTTLTEAALHGTAAYESWAGNLKD
jgi:hypothetical protein